MKIRMLPLFFAGMALCWMLTASFSEAADSSLSSQNVAIVGCLHCRPQDDSCSRFMRQVRDTHPAAVILLGKTLEAPIAQQKQYVEQVHKDLGVPVYTLNQDCPFVSLPELIKKKRSQDFQTPVRHKYPYHSQETSYSFLIGKTLFVWIDMGLFTGERGDEIAVKEETFIKKTIQAAPPDQNVVVLMDGSPWFSRKESLWFDRIHPLLKGRVSAVIGAGSHSFYTKEREGIVYVTTGYPINDDFETDRSSPHFMMFDAAARRPQLYVVPFSRNIPLQKFLGVLPIADAPDRAFEGPLKEPVIERDKSEDEVLLSMLPIRPEMTVVDVGAGVGTVSFLVADALKGTGKVYATEVDPTMIAAINKTIQKEHYRNVEAVLVTSQGLDPFYKQHRFDLIFLKNVYDLIGDPETFFHELLPSLRPETGRLVIISFKRVRGFAKGDLLDVHNIIRILNREGEDFPVFKRLSEATKSVVRNFTGAELSDESSRLFIDDFNHMLDDPLLVKDLISYISNDKYKAMISPVPLLNILDEKFLPLVNWLISELDEIGLFEKGVQAQFLLDKERVQKLNFIVLKNIFEKHLYTLLYDDSRAYVQSVPYFPGRVSIVRTLERAGYTFVGERSYHPYSNYLEFKR